MATIHTGRRVSLPGLLAGAVILAVAAMGVWAPLAHASATPTATTGSAANINGTGASLIGTVNPNGYSTKYHFQYGLTTSYGSETAWTGAGSGTTALSEQAAISGLTPGATYHFRIVARNGNGRSFGADATFTASAPTSPVAPTDTSVPSIAGSAVVGQTLSASPGSWSGSAPMSYAFQWQENGVNLAGATGSTYTLTSSDAGMQLDVAVTASNSAGSGIANSATTATVSSSSPTPSPFWNGDFSGNCWCQYDSYIDNNMDGNYPTDYAIVTNPHPPGWTYAAQYTTGPESTVSGQPGERTLDTLWATDPGTCWPGPCADGPSTWSLGKSQGYQGQTTWYRDQLYLPTNFQPLANSDWNTVFELHNYPDNNSAGHGVADANVICDITTTTGAYGPWDDGATSGARYSCRVAGGGSPASPIDSYSSSTWPNNPAVKWAYFVGLNPVPLGQWIDSVWYVKWSWQQDSLNGCTNSASVTGCMEWWVNGVKVASWSGPTLYYYANDGWNQGGPGQAYLQHGYYRNSSGTTTAGNVASSTAATTQVYHGGTMVGLSAASIGENLTP